jgi:hypothetical protein
MYGGMTFKLNFRNSDLQNANPAVADGKTGCTEQNDGKDASVNHGDGLRTKWIQ